ncbi:multidrug effflux MFS transporter [Chthonobacter albigriseus]|uniref:multidrug effflux MFS transporter n=1 Tax=Chthonobacter albigriseus TaxID=1683161 RepID=UPI0015EF0CE7|nr:multidrug effflux MFS transporter [Chthonobacter albigriseus]
MDAPAPIRSEQRAGPAFAEFVGIIACLMALTALGIDFLLPAFPPIGAEFSVSDSNDLQLLVYCYMIGFALMQLVYGPLSDMAGRRPLVIIGLVVFAIGCLASLFAPSFETLIAARVLQGMGAASSRVLAISIVRDRFGGRDMARVMSFVMMVFIIVPVFAPAVGGVVLLAGNWHLIFLVMLFASVAVLIWFAVRMPETLHPDYRMPLSAGRIAIAAARCVTTRTAFGYATAMGLMSGCLMGYIGSSEQIFGSEVYALGPWFPLAFGLVACLMGLGSFVNSRLVGSWGMRKLAHGATIGYVGVALLQTLAALAYEGHPPLWLFGALLAASNFLFSMTLPNFNAMSMEPLGDIAGTASSVIGFYTTLMGALLGLAVGQAFDGTVLPLTVSYFVLSAGTLLVVAWTERGKLFQPHQTNPAKPVPATGSRMP